MTEFDFGPLDAVEPPDQWADILQRSERPTSVVALSRRRLLLTTAAVVAAVAAVAGLVTVVTSGSDTADRSVGAGADPVTSGEPGPITCLEGGLAPGVVVPDDAVSQPSLSADQIQPGQQALSWESEGMQLELLVPATPYIDHPGARTSEVSNPEGLILRRESETRFLGRTGLGGTCASYALSAAGVEDDDRATRLHLLARNLEWDESLAETDCGHLSAKSIQTSDGTTASAAISDVDVADLALDPIGDGRWSPATALHLPDGRCQVPAATEGGMQVVLTVSGNDGRYAIDRIAGFLAEEDPLGSWSGRRSGVNVSVSLDYWCDDCAEATLTISYPEQDITESATVDQKSGFALTLPEPPPRDPSGIQVIVYRTADGAVRGVFADVEPAFILDSSL